ncbi:MAG TPA: hypothetical protein VMS21_00120 [Methylomirabilota bacterium]|nr:hypothetical protein [Methylomirabilota bacterium]
MPLPPGEEIVRAVHTDKWDGERLSPSLFVGENISVSRLAIIPLADHWDLFRQHVQQPPERLLELIAQINVGRLQAIGRDRNPSVELTVEQKPEEWNPAHAEIPQRITRGLANKILPELTLHGPPGPPAMK